MLTLPTTDHLSDTLESDLHRIVEQMPGILWTTDQDLNVTLSLGNGLARLNPAQRPREGMCLSEFFGDETVHTPLLDAHYSALEGRGQSFDIDVDGTLFRGTVEPLFNSDWNLIGTVGSAVEITDRQDAEMERSQQLAHCGEVEKRQAMTDLANCVTGHFGRLFRAISAYSAIVAVGLPDWHPCRRWLGNIDKAAQCASDLTEQLLVPGSAGGQDCEAVRFTDLIHNHLEVYRALLSKQTTLQVDLEQNNTAILGDPEDGRRLLVNLLVNASTSIGDGEGVVCLRTQVTKGPPWPVPDPHADNELPQGDYLWLQVSDTGRGLDDDDKARIFEPFAGYTGSGVGIGAALAMVSRLRGTMSISSKPGLGMTCHVFLPIMPPAATATAGPQCFF